MTAKKAKVRPRIKLEKDDVLKPVNDRKTGKVETSRKKKPKVERDPNMPKKPLTAFFLFMEGFRKIYKEQNPYVKSVTAVAKAGGEKWKTMSSGEKVPYEAKASKSKLDYEWQINAYYKQKAETKADVLRQEELDRSSSDQESDKSSESEDGSDDDDII